MPRRRAGSASGRFGPALLERSLERRVARVEGQTARLGAALSANVGAHQQRLLRTASRLSLDPIHRRLDQRAARLDGVAHRLERPVPLALDRAKVRLAALARALATLDPKRPKPGFARIDDADGRMITRAADLIAGQAVTLTFPDGSKGARIDGGDGESPAAPPAPRQPASRPAPRPRPVPPTQGDLF